MEDLQASGSAGEEPPIDPSTFRVIPGNGIIFGSGTKVDDAKQLLAKGGAKASIGENGAVQIGFAGSPNEQVTIQPAVGS